MTSDACSVLEGIGSSPQEGGDSLPVDPRDFMLSNLALSALKEHGYQALNSLSWFKVVYNRGDEGRVIVSFQDTFAHVELVKREREGGWTSLWEGYIEEYYTPFAAQAAEQAFEACKRHRYSYGDDYKNDIGTFVSGFLRDLLPAKTDVAKIYYRGGIGEAQDARDFIVSLPPDIDTEDARRELLDVNEPWDGPWHDPLRDRGFERVRADSWYKQYPFLDGYLVIMAEPHLNTPDEEGFDQTKPTLRLYCEYSNPRGGVDYPIQVFQRWVPLEVFPKALDLIESAFNTTNHLDGLQRTLEYGFYRLVPPLGPLTGWTSADTSVKEAVDAREFILANPSRRYRVHRLNWSNFYDDYHVECASPQEAFYAAQGRGDRVVSVTDEENGQVYVQNMWGQVIIKEAVDPKDFIADDLMLAFRNAMETRGWKFKKLSTVPKVDGTGNVQEHIFKYVSDGTIWTINASVLSDGRLYAFGSGFKVLQGCDSFGREAQADDDWTIEDITQEVGMTTDDFADLVTDTALSTHGQDISTYDWSGASFSHED